MHVIERGYAEQRQIKHKFRTFMLYPAGRTDGGALQVREH
jgi:hypothetical protein